MELKQYQKDAVKEIYDAAKTLRKMRVQIEIGLGRRVIIADLLQKWMNEEIKILVLSPNRSTCYQLKDLLLEVEKHVGIALSCEEYQDGIVLLTTYDDITQTGSFNFGIFDIVICDGIHYLDGSLIDGITENAHTSFIGFTSQLDDNVTGWFADAKCVFRYTRKEALNAEDILKGYEFESLVFKLFKRQGYNVDFTAQGNDCDYDIRADKEGKYYAIEVKRWNRTVSQSMLNRSIERLRQAAQSEDRKPKPVLVTTAVNLPQDKSLQDDIIVIGLQNLLYMVKGYPELEKLLMSSVEYSTDDINPVQPPFAWTSQGSAGEEESVIQRLKKQVETWKPEGTSNCKAYEELCFKVLRELFADDLAKWKEQKSSNDGLFVFDLICKIKSGNKKEVWRFFEDYFQSKFIVFEFKNYKEKITQKEIIITEKYLYLKALRTVAIIISPNGADENAQRIIRGVLRDDGKLIVDLTNADLIEMLEIKEKDEDPADYLCSKVDDIFISMEK